MKRDIGFVWATIWVIATMIVDVLVICFVWNMQLMPMRTLMMIGMIFKLTMDGTVVWVVDGMWDEKRRREEEEKTAWWQERQRRKEEEEKKTC